MLSSCRVGNDFTWIVLVVYRRLPRQRQRDEYRQKPNRSGVDELGYESLKLIQLRVREVCVRWMGSVEGKAELRIRIVDLIRESWCLQKIGVARWMIVFVLELFISSEKR